MLEPVRHEKEMIRVHADDILGHVVVPDDRGRADNECLAGTPQTVSFSKWRQAGLPVETLLHRPLTDAKSE
jgi:hypothetical protein